MPELQTLQVETHDEKFQNFHAIVKQKITSMFALIELIGRTKKFITYLWTHFTLVFSASV
jgi:hypothetical protein